MHPIERLRHVAAVPPDRPALLAREAASALAGCADAAELVVACRRLLDHRPAVGPLWWVASRAVIATEPRESLRASIEALDTDPTPAEVAAALTELPDHPVVDVLSLGETGALLAPEAARRAARSTTTWAVGGVGRALPRPVWEAALARLDALGRRGGAVLVPPETFALVAGPEGLTSFEAAVIAADCPLAPELLVPIR